MKIAFVRSQNGKGQCTGRALGIRDHYFITTGVMNTSPLNCLHELVRNSIDAGATEIDVFPGAGGHVVVQDNGEGMTREEMDLYLGHYGSGKSKRGHQDHFGHGLKGVVAAHNADKGVLITSWKRTGPKVAFSLALGLVESEPGTVVIGIRQISVDGGEAQEIARVDRPRNAAPSGTRVELLEVPFNQEEVMRAIGSRFVNLSVAVNVWSDIRDARTRKRVKGLIESIREVAQQEGVIELKNARVHWAIRKTDKAGEPVTTESIGNLCLFHAWKGEAFRCWPLNGGGRTLLNSYGIWAGAPRIILMVEATGIRIEATAERLNISGWEPAQVQEEFQAQMPRELVSFMYDWQEENFDPQGEKDLYQQLMRLMKVSPVSLTTHVAGGGSGSSGGGEGSGHPTPHTDTPRRPRPRPEPSEDDATSPRLGRKPLDYDFVSGKELVNEPAAYDRLENKVIINRDYPSIKAVLDQARGRKDVEQDLRALIAMQIAASVNGYIANGGGAPDEKIMRAICSFPGMALLHHLTGRKLRTLLTRLQKEHSK